MGAGWWCTSREASDRKSEIEHQLQVRPSVFVSCRLFVVVYSGRLTRSSVRFVIDFLPPLLSANQRSISDRELIHIKSLIRKWKQKQMTSRDVKGVALWTDDVVDHLFMWLLWCLVYLTGKAQVNGTGSGFVYLTRRTPWLTRAPSHWSALSSYSC